MSRGKWQYIVDEAHWRAVRKSEPSGEYDWVTWYPNGEHAIGLQSMLGRRGNEGWELVSAGHLPVSPGLLSPLTLIFKRQG
jgi:hypothetical protein